MSDRVDNAQAAMPRILTLSGTIPGEPGVGGVILNDLMSELPAGTLQFIPAATKQVIDLGWLKRAPELAGHVVRRFETGWRPLKGVAGELIGRAARLAKFSRHCRTLTDQICNSAAARDCDMVWAILDCPTVIEIALETAQRLNKPLIALVWDSPELLIDSLNMDRWSAAAMLKRFGDTIRSATRVGVICEQMQQRYESAFGAGEYVVLRHGIRENLWAEPTVADDESNRLIIGFAGSITAVRPFRQLVQTLDENKWSINGRNVTLRLIGSRYTLDSREAQHIEFFGWRSLEQTVKLLAECHMTYLPQPFEERLKPLAELSFPTKLTTYLAAGNRVLLHAPDYASVTSFMQDYAIGHSCDSLDSSNLTAALRELERMPQSAISDAINAARRNEFNSHTFVERFRTLVGVSKPSASVVASPELAGQV